jgi:hypothetical protein
MTHRTRLATIPLDLDELVVSVDERDRIDIRLWTDTSGVRMPSGKGVTVPRWALRDLIEALRRARRREAA